jgi:lipopolysaccharide biosynthesis glycosyltransferase
MITQKDRCIATSADANYFPALMALLRSLRATNGHIPVVVFDGGLTPLQRAKASRFAEIIKKKPVIRIEGKGKFSYIGDTTLLKLEVATLPSKKALYLDADMVVLEPLDALFEFPEDSVGAVLEVNSVRNMFRGKHRDLLKDKIDIKWTEKGFNAGLFALVPERWRDLGEKAGALIEAFGEDVFSKTKDQQLLNIIFSGKIHGFPKRYNFSPFYDDAGETRPAVIHYLSGCKPWHFDYPPGEFYRKFRENITVRDFPVVVLIDMYRKVQSLRNVKKASLQFVR